MEAAVTKAISREDSSLPLPLAPLLTNPLSSALKDARVSALFEYTFFEASENTHLTRPLPRPPSRRPLLGKFCGRLS